VLLLGLDGDGVLDDIQGFKARSMVKRHP
jgi:hypothetical protein